MPCSDSSSGLNIRFDAQERFLSFEFAKITCSSEITAQTGLSSYCHLKNLPEILDMDFNMIVSVLGLNEDQEKQFILYALGKCYSLLNEKFAGKPISVAISKGAFIELVKNAGFAGKGERALYQNLEDLEEKKFVSYERKNLSLTSKGKKIYELIEKRVEPYIAVADTSPEDLMKLTNKARTVLSGFI